VIERGGGLGLLHEALLGLRVARRVGSQELERNQAVQLQVLGEIDDAHAAPAELVHDTVVGDSPADHERAPPLSVAEYYAA
jgi:hypothetical protein